MLIDNIAVLGIESCLLEGLKDAFTAQTVMRLENDLVRKIAAENQESVTERIRTEDKVHTLEKGLHTLNRYRRSRHEGIEGLFGLRESLASSQLTNIAESEKDEFNYPADLKSPDTVNGVSQTATIEDVNEATQEVTQDLDHSVREAGNQELTHDSTNEWFGFPPDQKPLVSKLKSRKKGVKNRAAMFDNTVQVE